MWAAGGNGSQASVEWVGVGNKLLEAQQPPGGVVGEQATCGAVFLTAVLCFLLSLPSHSSPFPYPPPLFPQALSCPDFRSYCHLSQLTLWNNPDQGCSTCGLPAKSSPRSHDIQPTRLPNRLENLASGSSRSSAWLAPAAPGLSQQRGFMPRP